MKANKPGQGRDPKKVALYRKVERVRRRIVNGIKFAVAHGFEVRAGLYCSDGEVCPLAATVVKKKRLTSVPGSDNKRAFANGQPDNIIARTLRISANETEAFIMGFDGNFVDDLYRPNERAFAKLGQRLAKKYL